MDVTKLLLCNLSDITAPTQNAEVTMQSLDAAQLAVWVDKAGYELTSEVVQTVDNTHVECIGAFSGQRLLGYLFFCDSPVSAHRNSGGFTFTGIGLEFPTYVRYVYKALVLPEFRGQQLAARLMHYAGTHYQQHVTHIVTTTAWTNTAFLNAAKSVGFKAVGTAGEFVVFGQHRYYLPAHIDTGTGDGQCIKLIKPTFV